MSEQQRRQDQPVEISKRGRDQGGQGRGADEQVERRRREFEEQEEEGRTEILEHQTVGLDPKEIRRDTGFDRG